MTRQEERTEDARCLHRALDGDSAAMGTLVSRLTPIIQARVARCLVRHGRPESRRNLQDEVAELTQEVFVTLFARKRKVLKSWRADGGLSLNNFVGLVAERRALSILSSSRRSPWTEEPTEDLEAMLGTVEGPEALVASRQILERVIGELEEELSPLGLRLFQQLIVEEEDIADIAAQSGMKRGALYMWRSRLAKLIRQKAAALMLDSPPAGRTSLPEES